MEEHVVEGAMGPLEHGCNTLSFEDKAGLYLLYTSARKVGLAGPTILQLMDAATGYVDVCGTSHNAVTTVNVDAEVSETPEKGNRKARQTPKNADSVKPENVTNGIPGTPETVEAVTPEAPAAQENPVVESPAPAPTPEPEAPATPAPKADAPQPTKEQVMLKLKTLLKVDNSGAAAILQKHGAANLSALKPELYASVIADIDKALEPEDALIA